MVFVVLKRKLAPRGTQGSRNPEEEAWGEQTAKKSHLLNANYNNGLSLTIVCWDCQIKPPLAKLSVGHPLEEDTPIKALTVTMTFDMLSPPMAAPPPPCVFGGQESELITHLIIDVTDDRAFPDEASVK